MEGRANGFVEACYKGGDVVGEVVMCKCVYALQSLVSRWILGGLWVL
jgi:hypothetical protein